MSLTDEFDQTMASGVDLRAMLDPTASDEVRRIMQICNACRYCEGFCAVFPAMERRRRCSSDSNKLHPGHPCKIQ